MVTTKSTEKFRGLTVIDTVMAPSIKVFLQVALLYCLVTTGMGSITDWQKKFSQLENKVQVQQKEIRSLQQITEHLEKRLEELEMKGEFDEVQIQPAVLLLFLLVRIILLWIIEIIHSLCESVNKNIE